MLIHMVFPAYAGVIPPIFDMILMLKCLSRVCGGDPSFMSYSGHNKKSFPRMRG